jgi:hypothetical protein
MDSRVYVDPAEVRCDEQPPLAGVHQAGQGQPAADYLGPVTDLVEDLECEAVEPPEHAPRAAAPEVSGEASLGDDCSLEVDKAASTVVFTCSPRAARRGFATRGVAGRPRPVGFGF